jgi:hypothetical protein
MSILFGDLNKIGVEVFIDASEVVLSDAQDTIRLPDTNENREKLIVQAKELIALWEKESK